ncbi:MAG: 50S ribosome-binding GTPase [Planctomycetales bacterium]|nr:50S ribosome-binding GTPase [Planctomycetales bacterium]
MNHDGHRESNLQACLLTAPEPSAVAVIALAGANASHCLQSLFEPVTPGALAAAKPGRVMFGRWKDGGEELLVCRRSDDRWEIHCHGGRVAAARVLRSLIEMGVSVTNAEQWNLFPEQSGAANEAWRLLSRAATARTAAILLDQARGAWDAAAASIEQALAAGSLDVAREQVVELQRWAELGAHLTSPWRVVLVGVPNAGKSTLLNRLLGFERSVVFDQPGTTRDAVTTRTVIDGWPVEICDTAGLRQTSDELEQAGAELARQAAADCDLAIHVVDLSADECDQLVSLPPRSLRVGSKLDLTRDVPTQASNLDLCVSAATGEGIEELLERIATRLVPAVPPPGSAVPFSNSCREQLAAWVAKCELTQRA